MDCPLIPTTQTFFPQESWMSTQRKYILCSANGVYCYRTFHGVQNVNLPSIECKKVPGHKGGVFRVCVSCTIWDVSPMESRRAINLSAVQGGLAVASFYPCCQGPSTSCPRRSAIGLCHLQSSLGKSCRKYQWSWPRRWFPSVLTRSQETH